jgi:hypothetical protein
VKLETREPGCQVVIAPIDHPLMQVESDISLRRGVLARKLSSKTTTATPKVHDEPATVGVDVWEDRARVSAVKRGGVDNSHELPKLGGWDWQLKTLRERSAPSQDVSHPHLAECRGGHWSS